VDNHSEPDRVRPTTGHPPKVSPKRRMRRQSGKGAVIQRSDGRWAGRLNQPDGTVRWFYGKGPKGQKTVEDRLEAALATMASGLPLPDDKLTVGAYLEQWLAGLLVGTAKPATIAYYTRYVRFHVLTSDLVKKALSRLDAADLRRLYAQKLAAGLSSTTVHHLHAVIHLALNSAVEDGKLARNVASLIGRSNCPKVTRKEMVTIAEGDQPRRFLDAAHHERLEALLVIALTTGLRQGELRALRWKDVDLDRGVLAVRGSLMGTARATMTIGTPKNGKARSVDLGSIAVASLREHRARQVEERKVVPLRGDLGLVFCTEWGEYLPTNTIVLALHRVLSRAGLPMIRFHDLRHTAATLMLSQGVHPKMASEMLGHSTVAITLDLYSHITPTMQRQAADAIDRALTDPLVIGS
jgi:integrase